MSLNESDDSDEDEYDFDNIEDAVIDTFMCCDNMVYDSISNSYKCPVCSKIISLAGDNSTISSDYIDRNIKISRMRHTPYLENPKLNNTEKIYNTLSEINGKLNNKIPDKYFQDIIKYVENIKKVLKNRGEIDDSIFVQCIYNVATENNLSISIDELQKSLNIPNKKIYSGKKRIQNTIISGHSNLETNQDKELDNILFSMINKINLQHNFIPLLHKYLDIYNKYIRKARDIKSLCSGVIWTVKKRLNINITDEQMKLLGVSSSTYITIYNEIVAVLK